MAQHGLLAMSYKDLAVLYSKSGDLPAAVATARLVCDPGSVPAGL